MPGVSIPLFSQKCWSFTLRRHEEYKRKINQILLLSENDPNFRLSKKDNPDEAVSLIDHTQTNVYAWKSNWRLHEHFTIFNELCEDLKPCFTQIIKEEKIKDTSEIEAVDCWVNQYKKGDYTVSHAHEPNGWMAVYFMNIPKDTKSVFRVFNPLGTTYNSELPENCNALDVKAKEGSILIMSGSILHEATTNTSDETRITVPMNFRIYEKFLPKIKNSETNNTVSVQESHDPI